MFKKIITFLFIISVFLGLMWRLSILTISFEYDEIFTAVSTNPALPLSYIWKNFLMVDVHPPFYNILLWVYNHGVPYGPEWVLRLPSLIFGVLALGEAWFLFPRFLGKTARLLFALLLSCNFYLIIYAQHARAYSLLLLLAIPLTFLYLHIARYARLRRPVPGTWWLSYGLLSVFLCWSHYFGALLFGLFSVVLFCNAWRYKQPLRWFIWVPLLVLVCFSPWLIPNLMVNISQSRFTGNWWGNSREVSWNLVILWIEFFFSSLKSFYVLVGLTVVGGVYSGYQLWHRGQWPYRRELVLLLIPMAVAGAFTLAISSKIFWLLWRYFIPFMPSLYLWIALLLAPVCKRHKVLLLGIFVFVGVSFYTFYVAWPYFKQDNFFPARGSIQVYQKVFADKDLYVVAIEAFPPQSFQPMYAFYPQHYFKMKREVYDLVHMPAPQRDQLLQQQRNALIWMPNCEEFKIERISKEWGRNMVTFGNYRGSCFLVATEADRTTVDSEMMADYTNRFAAYMEQQERQPKPRFLGLFESHN